MQIADGGPEALRSAFPEAAEVHRSVAPAVTKLLKGDISQVTDEMVVPPAAGLSGGDRHIVEAIIAVVHPLDELFEQCVAVGGGSDGNKESLPDDAVRKIEKNVGKVPGADYVLCQCYLGFRPSEFLALDVQNYTRKERAFVGGAKTDAGRDRVVTISPKIQGIIDRLTKDKIAGPVFC